MVVWQARSCSCDRKPSRQQAPDLSTRTLPIALQPFRPSAVLIYQSLPSSPITCLSRPAISQPSSPLKSASSRRPGLGFFTLCRLTTIRSSIKNGCSVLTLSRIATAAELRVESGADRRALGQRGDSYTASTVDQEHEQGSLTGRVQLAIVDSYYDTALYMTYLEQLDAAIVLLYTKTASRIAASSQPRRRAAQIRANHAHSAWHSILLASGVCKSR